MLDQSGPMRWRDAIVYSLMSLFSVWHAICLIVGPAPQESQISQALRPLVGSYLKLISLDVKWGFFAPIGGASEFRYVVRDSEGESHLFRPTSKLAWYDPGKLWIIDRYRVARQLPEVYGDILIAEHCQVHAALKPAEIRLVEVVQQKDFWVSDHLAGKHPLDEQFATTQTLRTGTCSRP
jgi:hypothetical protein